MGEDLSHRLMNRLGALGELLAFGVPPAAAMLALTAALGWSVAFLSEFLRNKNFLTVRTGRVLEVHPGTLYLRSCLVQADRIRFVQIRETAASRLLGLGAVYLHAVGVSRKQEDLLPVIRWCAPNSFRLCSGDCSRSSCPARSQCVRLSAPFCGSPARLWLP